MILLNKSVVDGIGIQLTITLVVNKILHEVDTNQGRWKGVGKRFISDGTVPPDYKLESVDCGNHAFIGRYLFQEFQLNFIKID